MGSNMSLDNYKRLDIGTDIVIRFFDGTLLKGVVKGFNDNTISINRACIWFPQRKIEFKVTTANVNVNSFNSLIHSVPHLKQSCLN